MRIFQQIYFLGILLAVVNGLTSCVEVLDSNYQVDAPVLVVQASVLDTITEDMSEEYPMQVSIFSLVPSQSIYLDGALDDFGVIDAQVQIIDTDDNRYQLVHLSDGMYSNASLGRAGVGYRLEITFSDGGTITSETEYIPTPSTTVDSMSLNVEDSMVDLGDGTIVPTVEVSAMVHLNNSGSNDAFHLYKSWREYEFREDPDVASGFPKTCYIGEPIDSRTTMIAPIRADQSTIIHRASSVDYDLRFAFKMFFHIYRYHISESTYAYFEQVEQNKSQSDALFAPIPGKIETNILLKDDDRNLQGYFTVASVDYKRIKADALILQQTPIYACPSNSSRPWANNVLREFCGDCLNYSNATLERPSYW